MKTINYYWRILATGFCFATFGLGALFISLVIFPIQYLLYGKENRTKAARKVVIKTFYLFARTMEIVGVLRIRVNGLKEIVDLKGAIIVANHPSLIDVVVMIAYLPNTDCIIKSELFKNPFIKGVVSGVGYISNDDPELIIEDCKKSLASGYNIIIFPEGTRTVPGKSLKFRRGAANIAIRCQAHYLPVLITVNPTTLTKNQPWYDVPPRKVEIELKVLPLMELTEYFEMPNVSLAARSLTSTMQNYFTKELAESG